MTDPRFFERRGPFRLGELAAIGEAVIESGDPDAEIADLAPLATAGTSELTFLDNKRYRDQARTCEAAACLVRSDLASDLPPGVARLVTADPYRAYAKIGAAFYPEAASPEITAPEPGIAPGAHVDPDADVDRTARIGPGVVVLAGATIGARTDIGPNAVIGANVVIGSDCRIGPTATIVHALVGDRVVIHAGVRIGQDGFGFAMGPDGHLKVPQLGRVLIEDDVEIGANATVDRGAGPDTVIGRGAKIDNLVMIAHNVVIGAGCVVVAQSGISGSTEIGEGSVLAAQVGITGHLKIGPRVQLVARSAPIRDLPGDAIYGGAPAIPVNEWRRQMAAIARLGKRKGSSS